ncbi:response regulator [Paludibacterium purpuratum]|uniref:DNA-binding NarL/FixJ family response regulator n=1 Tax=Paludibacterium purpuratum TaxID=1144873 RepID=A0A4V3DVM2_9NEIS|nr:response regulator [Paludibacterium purpuratum]TDR81509.1 DNA-binding NarL/FixJ family response regulator [Paludibacterium purpuratum]
MGVDLSTVKVLVVDDQLLVRTLISQVLRNFGVKSEAVFQATDGNNALHVLAARQVDIILCDMQMAPVNGMDLLKEIRCARTPNPPNLPFVFLSGHPERNNILLASKLHADGFVIKPPKPNDIEKNLLTALERPRPAIDPFGYLAIATGSEYDTRNFELPLAPKQSHDLDLLLDRFHVDKEIKAVVPGDIMSKDLLDQNGRVLLPRGVKIQKVQLAILAKYQALYGVHTLAVAELPHDQMIMYQDYYGINPE